jgi:putative transport protein
MGRMGRIGRFVTSLPHTAASVLAELGLLIFVAFAGTKAGSLIVAAIVSGEVVTLLLLGAVITIFAMFGIYLVVRYVFRLGGTRLSGLIGGAQTSAAVLAFANTRTGYDVRVALGYSLVYPAAMVVKILLAQVLVGL